MKKLILLLLICNLHFAINNLLAQTIVSSGIFSNTTWTQAGSPYIITDTVVLFPGLILTIQPGVTVKFDNNMYLEIRQSTLIANGTSTDSITFTSNSPSPTPGIWGRIYLSNTVYVVFDYCNIKYSNRSIQGLSCDSIKHSTFNFNSQGISTSYCKIDSCVIRNNTEAIAYLGNSKVLNSDLSNNQTGIVDLVQTQVINCKINNNIQMGVQTSNNNRIQNCVIDSNGTNGIFLFGYADTLKTCEIMYNNIGIREHNMAGMTPVNIITQNVIQNNYIGVFLERVESNIYCNKICSNTLYDLQNGTTFPMSIPNNYWCTIDSTSTSALIYDAYDNASLGIISFMPIDTASCFFTGCNLAISSTVINATCDTCHNGSATATVMNGFAPYTYTWYTSPLQNTQTATGLASGWHTVCVMDGNSCTFCDSVFVDSTNCTGFTAYAHANNSTCSACNDGSAKVVAFGGTPPYNYTWYTAPIQTTDSISNLIQGNYAVCVTDNYGCAVCDTVAVSIGNCSAHYNLYADTIPHSYIAMNMASGVNPILYTWDWGDGAFSYTAYPSHTYAAAGFYSITLSIIDSAGCTNSYNSSYYLLMPLQSMIQVNVIPYQSVTTNDLNKESDYLTLSPNPTEGELRISDFEFRIESVKITNVLSETVYQSAITTSQSEISIDVSALAKGLYFVEVAGDRRVMRGKFVKE